jgi:cation:H+ antiporter
MTALLFLLGIGFLALGGDLVVRGASGFALAAGMSRLIVGLTVVGAGTSAPELAVCVQAALDGRGGIAIGNVVGSNIANILLILGAAAIVRPFSVPRAAVRRDLPIAIGATLLVIAFATDGALTRTDGAVLVLGLVAGLAYTVREERKAASANPATTVSRRSRESLAQVGITVAGLGLLVLGARWVVVGAVAGARALGWSELVIGLTVVAVGTSLPELVASSASALRGEGGLAVGNVFGSNIFNFLGVLGVTLLVSPSPLPVERTTILKDLPIALAAVVLCIPILGRGLRIGRVGGGVLLCCFVTYTLLTLGAFK